MKHLKNKTVRIVMKGGTITGTFTRYDVLSKNLIFVVLDDTTTVNWKFIKTITVVE